MEQLSFSIHKSIASIDADDWNACAFPPGRPYHPFVDHRFLNALELSGCVTEQHGWQPIHLELKHKDETVGCIPVYLKSHSRGEYVFDYSWAEACYRAGINYYPKLQICIPFTPAAGTRILIKPSESHETLESVLIQRLIELTNELNASSAHITFLPQAQWFSTRLAGLLRRMDLQFHWANDGYQSFDDFIAQLTSKKRKNIRRERREIMASGLQVEWLTGSDLREHHWDVFYEFYRETSAKKWGTAYLNREFFSRVSATMSERILLILCRRGPKFIAGAIHFIGEEALYGRNWGCIEHVPFLHFELCYYQAMEYAIQHQLRRLEAGAQGGHKFARGYTAQRTYSLHYIANEKFRAAVAQFLAAELQYVQSDFEYLNLQTPYRRDTSVVAASASGNTDDALPIA